MAKSGRDGEPSTIKKALIDTVILVYPDTLELHYRLLIVHIYNKCICLNYILLLLF